MSWLVGALGLSVSLLAALCLVARWLDAYGASRAASLGSAPFDAIIVAVWGVRPDGRAIESLRRRACGARAARPA